MHISTKLQTKIKELEILNDYPVLALDKAKFAQNIEIFKNFGLDHTSYAIKCNPMPCVMEEMLKYVSNFDVASLEEVQYVLELSKKYGKKVNIFYHNPVKSEFSIKFALQNGVKHFSVDNLSEVKKMYRCLEELNQGLANKYEVSLNLRHDFNIKNRKAPKENSCLYPLSVKFGASDETILEMFEYINKRNVPKVEIGLYCHVGSQTFFSCAYEDAASKLKELYDLYNSKYSGNVKITSINLGGGMPAQFNNSKYFINENSTEVLDLNEYMQSILGYIKKIFAKEVADNLIKFYIEPGRALVSNTQYGIIKIIGRNGEKVYLNNGVYGLFGEIAMSPNKQIPRFYICNENFEEMKVVKTLEDFAGNATGKEVVNFYGPTCDGHDKLPFNVVVEGENFKEGSYLIFEQVGAYGCSMTSNFNGFGHYNILDFNTSEEL